MKELSLLFLISFLVSCRSQISENEKNQLLSSLHGEPFSNELFLEGISKLEDINFIDSISTLSEATFFGNVDQVEILLNNGANPFIKLPPEYGSPSLHNPTELAAWFSFIKNDVYKYFIEDLVKGKKIDRFTPLLDKDVNSYNYQLILGMLSHAERNFQAKPNYYDKSRDKDNQRFEAYYAAQTCNTKILSELMKEGYDINLGGNVAPLVVATTYGKVDCVKALLEMGANPFVESSNPGNFTVIVSRPRVIAQAVISLYAEYDVEKIKSQLDKTSSLYEVVDKKIPVENFKEIEKMLEEAESKWKK